MTPAVTLTADVRRDAFWLAWGGSGDGRPAELMGTVTHMLRVSGLTRRFGDHLALDDVTFDVGAGRMTGFVGANGAGKTTTMRIILGVLAADAGSVTWQGAPLGKEIRRQVGYMPEERGLYPKMSVREQLVYLGRLHGLTLERVKRNAADLLERLGLAERADDPLQ